MRTLLDKLRCPFNLLEQETSEKALADLQTDAARYRWLRENPEAVIDDMDQSMLLSDTALDCTVDAAVRHDSEK